MNKRILLVSALLSTLLFTGVVGTQLVYLGKANPNPTGPLSFHKGETTPYSSERPPEISITSPKNNTICIATSLNLTLSVSVKESNSGTTRYIDEIIYKVDWLPQNTTVYKRAIPKDFEPSPIINEFSNSINLTNIPEGTHNIVIYAIEIGWYKYRTGEKLGLHPVYHTYSFNLSSSSAVRFNVDSISPEISILQMQNKTFTDPNLPLHFTVNEPVSRVWYVLDGQEKVTIAGNITLTDLSCGEHNVTVYATDEAGNMGVSETLFFTVEPFPTLLVATASIVTMAVFAVFVLARKHKP